MRSSPPSRVLRLLGGLLALYLAVPVAAFVIRLARTPAPGFSVPGLWSALAVSAATATISMALIALFGLPLAYSLARSRSRLASVVTVIAALPLALPPLMSGILLIYLVGPYSAVGRLFGGRLTESMAGIVLAQTFVAAPFLIAVARAAFSDVDPALFDLAATLGHGESSRFFRVALSAARGGVAAGLLLAWLRAFGEYGATVILAYHPYSLPVFTYLQFGGAGLSTTEAPTALALGLAAVVVLAARGISAGHFLRRATPPPAAARAATPTRPTPVEFALGLHLGSFELDLAHNAAHPTLAILGASGSGKSATLRALAGLFGGGAGRVVFGGDDVSRLAPEARHVGYVPQSGSLFPHLPVWRQVTFSPHADPALGAYWLERLGLSDLADRQPEQLSGGQRQRVQLAQALCTSPRLLLLDEPFSALDAPVREALRLDFRRLQRDAGLSSVLVTHDPAEAAMLAEELLVISGGHLLQAGDRAEVFAAPASAEVARLLGVENVLRGERRDGVLHTGALSVGLPEARHDGAVEWCIPAHAVGVGAGPHEAPVSEVIDRGLLRLAALDLGGGALLLGEVGRGVAPGERARFSIESEAITCWPASPQARLGQNGARPAPPPPAGRLISTKGDPSAP